VSPALRVAVAILATWRVTHLLQAEDGPADVFVGLRRLAGRGVIGKLLDCFYCLSLWIAAPFAFLTGSTWPERGMLWLALSGGSCILERLKPSAPAALYVEDQEDVTDALLRQQSSASVVDDDPFGQAGPAAGGAGPAQPRTGGDPQIGGIPRRPRGGSS
jgi:hypothetical protein